MEPVSFAELIRSSQKVDEPVSWSTSQIVKKGTATDCGAVFSEKWAGAASNRRHQDFQAVATPQTPLERKRNRPSHCQLRTWAVWCGLMRLQAQVAEEGLEQPHEPCGVEVVSETPGATSDVNLLIVESIVDQLRRQLTPTALDQLVALLASAGDRQPTNPTAVARGEGGDISTVLP